jgi:hypothetical protein
VIKRLFVSRLLLFVSAGTLAWPAAWVYLALIAVMGLGIKRRRSLVIGALDDGESRARRPP